jgi:hypothetical protein
LFCKTSDNFMKLNFNIGVYISSRCRDVYVLMPSCISKRAPGPLARRKFSSWRTGSTVAGTAFRPAFFLPQHVVLQSPLFTRYNCPRFWRSVIIPSSVLNKMIKIGLYETRSNNGFIFISLFSSPSARVEFFNFFQLTAHRTRR